MLGTGYITETAQLLLVSLIQTPGHQAVLSATNTAKQQSPLPDETHLEGHGNLFCQEKALAQVADII